VHVVSGAIDAKKVHARFKIAFVVTDRFKKTARFEKVIRKKLPGAEIVSRSFTPGNNRFLACSARVAPDHLVPRNVSVFSRVHLFRMDDQPWRETM
jgi:hypothetical protein